MLQPNLTQGGIIIDKKNATTTEGLHLHIAPYGPFSFLCLPKVNRFVMDLKIVSKHLKQILVNLQLLFELILFAIFVKNLKQ